MERAGAARFFSLDEGLPYNLGTSGGCAVSARGINIDHFDTGGRNKIINRRPGRGSLHKFCPDRKRSLGTRQAELALIIKSHPDNGQQFRCVPHKPGIFEIVGGAGLSCRRSIETPQTPPPPPPPPPPPTLPSP